MHADGHGWKNSRGSRVERHGSNNNDQWTEEKELRIDAKEGQWDAGYQILFCSILYFRLSILQRVCALRGPLMGDPSVFLGREVKGELWREKGDDGSVKCEVWSVKCEEKKNNIKSRRRRGERQEWGNVKGEGRERPKCHNEGSNLNDFCIV